MAPSPTGRPGPTPLRCDGCGFEIPPEAPMATLEVVGPRDRDTVRPVGDYCEKCWEHILAAMDLIEELLARDDARGELRPAVSRSTHRVNCDGRKRRP